MEKYQKIIESNPLFAGIEMNQFKVMLSCIQGQIQIYQKNSVILLAGTPVTTIGLVLSGLVQVLREDQQGRQYLLTQLHVGELFGEVFACAGITHSPVTVMAADTSEVLHLNFRQVITICSSACSFHQKLIENMLALMAQKNLLLNQKIDILSKRTTRERLLLFFEQFANGARCFNIPYSREELASYLCVERSAMSAELSNMQRDGLIKYHRNKFELL